MADAFRITQEIDFFDVADYEERAATYETLHSATTRSIRDGWIRRGLVLAGSLGFFALFWNVMGGPGAEAQASSASVVVAPSEAMAAPVADLSAAEPVLPPVAARLIPGPSAWGVAKGFDVLNEPEELLVAELSNSLLARLQAPPTVTPAITPAVAPAQRLPAARRPPAQAPPRPTPVKTRPSRSQTLDEAVALHDDGRSDEALGVLRRLGAHPEALLLKGSIYQDKGDDVAARELYEGYLKRHPTGGHADHVRSILRRL